MSLEEHWGILEFENLKGTPWQLKEPRAVVARQTMLAGGEAIPLAIMPNPWRTAHMEVVRAERRVERLGATGGCVACTHLVLGP